MKKLLLILLVVLLSGCLNKAIRILNNEGLDGVSISSSISKEKLKNGNYAYHYTNEYRNDSDQEIMEIMYSMVFCDKKGNELFTFSNSWNGDNTPLKKGESFSESYGFQKEIEADSVKISVTSVKDSSEKPPVKLPEIGEPLYLAIQNEHLNNIPNEYPVKVEIIIDHMGAQDITVIEDEEIPGFVEIFTKVLIGPESNYFVTDNYNGIQFYFADGSKCYLPFILYALDVYAYGNEHLYDLVNAEPMWAYALMKEGY